MLKTVQSIRGMHDILPSQSRYWRFLETAIQQLMRNYGYQEIRLPIVESTELFKRTIGEATDIIEKEMYTFEDRNGDHLSLRPEGTAGCVRAGIENGLLHNQVQRLWYLGPMFRHERPQKGRYRQFYQAGVETFGMAGPDIDAELIMMSARLWRMLGLTGLQLQINSLGSPETHAAYRRQLVEYLSAHESDLDEDSRRRLHTNPLRILDSKNETVQEILAHAPRLTEILDEASQEHLAGLQSLLDAAGISYVLNPRLVRGLDYYSRTVFEWVSERLGAQGTVCAGGRYDGLVAQLGGSPTPAAGMAMGLDRLVALLQQEREELAGPDEPDFYFVIVGNKAERVGMLWAEQLRQQCPAVSLIVHCGGGSFKSQLKKADKSGATYALILGDDEAAQACLSIKPLRSDLPQQTWAWQRFMAQIIASGERYSEPEVFMQSS